MCVNFELDGRGSLEVFPDGAVISVFEYKSSPSGAASVVKAKTYHYCIADERRVGLSCNTSFHLYVPFDASSAHSRSSARSVKGSDPTLR